MNLLVLDDIAVDRQLISSRMRQILRVGVRKWTMKSKWRRLTVAGAQPASKLISTVMIAMVHDYTHSSHVRVYGRAADCPCY